MRSILLVGSVGVGKTTLKQRLRGEDLEYAKTQALEVHDGVIDTPGEFLESRFYKHSLSSSCRRRTSAEPASLPGSRRRSTAR
jgi:ethanolamine utilization protein EutP